jgi:uncharacterized SAM-binding protein YcdF (DUF218 family)
VGVCVSLGSRPSALLIPPLNFLSWGLAGVVLATQRRKPWRRIGRWMSGLAIVGLFVLALPFTSAALLWSLERGLPHGDVPAPPVASGSSTGRPEAIVILSADAGYGAKGGIEPGSGIGAMTLDRMRAGAILARRTGLPILVTGGPLEVGAEPIATQMAASLHADFGLATRWIEPRSADTWQNAEFSAKLLRADGIGAAYVVTNAWHLKRALIAFAHAGIAATPAPIRFQRPPEFKIDDFVPHISALQGSEYAIHEWIGCAYYALR